MQFTCDKNIILKEISVAHEIISSKNAISILSNVLLEATEDHLNIKATDLKISSFETRIPVNVKQQGATTVFCDKLLGILRTLPDEEVEFTLNENGKLNIVCGSQSNYTFNCISAEKFPEIASSDEDSYFAIPQKDFTEMISQTAFAVSDDETRYYLNGIYMEKDENRLVMVATDGRRLSFVAKEIAYQIPDFSGIIIPPKVLNLIRKLASGEGELHLSIFEKMLFVRFDNQQITSTLLDGQFPNYSQVIPKEQEFEIQVNRDSLLKAVKRISIMAENNSKRIYMTVTNDSMRLHSEETEIGSGSENLECQYQGEESTFSLNHQYLSDPLKVMECEDVRIKFSDTVRAVTMETIPQSSSFHIIMPIHKG